MEKFLTIHCYWKLQARTRCFHGTEYSFDHIEVFDHKDGAAVHLHRVGWTSKLSVSARSHSFWKGGCRLTQRWDKTAGDSNNINKSAFYTDFGNKSIKTNMPSICFLSKENAVLQTTSSFIYPCIAETAEMLQNGTSFMIQVGWSYEAWLTFWGFNGYEV